MRLKTFYSVKVNVVKLIKSKFPKAENKITKQFKEILLENIYFSQEENWFYSL